MQHTPSCCINEERRRLVAVIGGLALLAVLAFLTLVLVVDRRGGIIWGSDQAHYYAYARSLVMDRDLDFSNEYSRLGVSEIDPAPIGRPSNKYPIGFPFAVLPFYLLVHLAALFLKSLGAAIDTSGYSTLYQLAFCLGSIAYGCAGLLIAAKLARRYASETAALAAVISIFLASNLVYYFIREPFMSHLVSFFAASLFFYWWSMSRENSLSTRPFIFMGMAAGLLVVTRQQDAVFLVIPAADGIIGYLKAKERPWFFRPRALAGFLFGFTPFLCLQLAAWKMIYGSFLVYSYGEESFLYALSPKVLETLFSSRHGLLSWHPILLLGLIGLARLIHARPRTGLLLVSGLLLQLYVSASWWWFGHSFGHRAFISSLPIFMIGLAMLIEPVRQKAWRWWGLIGIALLAAWNMIMILAYLSEMIPYADYFRWRDLFMRLCGLPGYILRKARGLE